METTFPAADTKRGQHDQRSFLLQRAQPAMAGLIDGSLSTLAPIFAVAFATHQSRYAFLAGLATAIGAAVSMSGLGYCDFYGPRSRSGRAEMSSVVGLWSGGAPHLAGSA